jgi:hypothetical protein
MKAVIWLFLLSKFRTLLSQMRCDQNHRRSVVSPENPFPRYLIVNPMSQKFWQNLHFPNLTIFIESSKSQIFLKIKKDCILNVM